MAKVQQSLGVELAEARAIHIIDGGEENRQRVLDLGRAVAVQADSAAERSRDAMARLDSVVRSIIPAEIVSVDREGL